MTAFSYQMSFLDYKKRPMILKELQIYYGSVNKIIKLFLYIFLFLDHKHGKRFDYYYNETNKQMSIFILYEKGSFGEEKWVEEIDYLRDSGKWYVNGDKQYTEDVMQDVQVNENSVIIYGSNVHRVKIIFCFVIIAFRYNIIHSLWHNFKSSESTE